MECPVHPGNTCPRLNLLLSGSYGIECDVEEKRLLDLSRYRLDEDSAVDIFDDIAQIGLTLFDVPVCLVSVVMKNDIMVRATEAGERGHQSSTSYLKREEGTCAFTILSEQVLCIPDTDKDERTRCLPVVTSGPQYKFYCGAPLITPSGRHIGAIVALDIRPRTLTESQKDSLKLLRNQIITQLELRRQNEELQRLNNEKVKFLGIIGHDIRQPLCSIQVSSEMLLNENSRLDDASRELVENIQSSSEFMSFLIDNLLHVSRHELSSITNSEHTLNLRRVDPIVVLQRNALANSRLAARKDITISTTYDDNVKQRIKDLHVIIDVFRIEQVLNNLISNAIKFSHSHTTVEIHLSIIKSLSVDSVQDDDAQEFLSISVRDQGLGIPVDEVPFLFDSSKRISTKPTGNENSTGLGLSIVKQIVTQHQGQISVDSTQNYGSRFTFTLPLVSEITSPSAARAILTEFPSLIHPPALQGTTNSQEPKKIDRPPTSSLRSSSMGTLPLGNQITERELPDTPSTVLKILVAEDNLLNQKLVNTILSKRGHQVQTVNNGKEAVEAFSLQSFDVVVLDHEMPIMNGLEACIAIRELNADIPIISMSGTIDPEMEDLRQKSGMNTYITKPFRVKELLSVVEGMHEDYVELLKKKR